MTFVSNGYDATTAADYKAGFVIIIIIIEDIFKVA